MLLSKEIVVYLNLAGCRVRQYTSSHLRKNNINLTPEQFLTIDILWNQGAMSYLLLLFALVSCGTAQEVYEPTGQRFVYRLDGKPEICCPDASCCDSAKKIAGGESALLYGMDSYKYAFLLA